MQTVTSHFAVADTQAAAAVAGAAAAVSPFTIEVRFMGGLSQQQMDAFAGAADRWVQIIVGDLPTMLVDGETIDDLLILAQGQPIDGPGKILGQAGSTAVRPPSAGGLPAKGIMVFDTDDLQEMEAEGTLNDVIVHEMGHVLGIGKTIWELKELLQDAGTTNPIFIGENASREYGVLRGTGPVPVPVENVGQPGTRDTHWRETVFATELMTGIVAAANNPISRMSVACLQDLGYEVDYNGAEPYVLPDLLAMAEAGLLTPHAAPIDRGVVLTTIPIVLPEESVQ